jgi:hypothetical protein
VLTLIEVVMNELAFLNGPKPGQKIRIKRIPLQLLSTSSLPLLSLSISVLVLPDKV